VRFIIIHKTNPHWEAGAIPGADLIARVGALIGDLVAEKRLLGAEGLRPSAEGLRLTFSGGRPTMSKGPFEGGNELPAGFTILRVASIDDAVAWTTRLAAVLGDIEVDIRPVTEPWDIGMAPAPDHLETRRYMVLRKATAATEGETGFSIEQRLALERLLDQTARDGKHLLTEALQPSRRGRRYRNSSEGVTIVDGPFTESKELIAGYMMISAGSLAEASEWAMRYLAAVGAEEVDLREVVAVNP
jgi:hypothetical protein